MLTRLERTGDGLREVGLVDKQPISNKRKSILNNVSRSHTKKPSPAEKRMRFHLNRLCKILDNKIYYKLERQVHLADCLGRVLDMYFPRQRLALEFDGKQHLQTRDWDTWRDELLARHKVTVVRISNKDIFEDLSGVMGKIILSLISGGRMGKSSKTSLLKLSRSLHEGRKWEEVLGEWIGLNHRS